MNDNTEFTPVSPNTLTSTHGSNACKNPPGNPTVYKTTAIVKLPDGFIQQFNQLAVRSTANINGPLNVYGIKVPVGTSWEFVNPDAFPNVMYPVRLTLKVWTE